MLAREDNEILTRVRLLGEDLVAFRDTRDLDIAHISNLHQFDAMGTDDDPVVAEATLAVAEQDNPAG